ncbi:myosin-3-like [Papaver somniferum]|uniref:myosin-3-like n=1 Tax=Papaver somniferum TaxID=3469 RepID=UPI000E6F4FC5|nr:myosin-3-like [Papaver somniferum]
MVIADGYQYGYTQQHILEIMRTEHCNNTLYQLFKAKALKLEAKFCHREKELNAAEVLIAARDKEILELKNRLKGKEQLGAEEEKLRVELASVRSELEKAQKDASSSKAADTIELIWLRNERTQQTTRIKELVEKIKREADKWNARADEHNTIVSEWRERLTQMVDIQNSYNTDHRQFNDTLLWTRENLRVARENATSLKAKVTHLEEELRQALLSHDPEVKDYIQRLVRERDDVRAEAHSLSNALTTSRVDVARLFGSEKDLEVNMYRLTKGIKEMNNEVNHLRHLDSMNQVELDECQFALKNLRFDYKKFSDEYDFLDDARDAVVNEYEISSARVEGLAKPRDEAAKEASKEVTRLTSALSQSELKTTVITYKARCHLAEEINKTLSKIEQGLKKDYGIVKDYPRRPMPDPLAYSSGPSSGGSVPSPQQKDPADNAGSSMGK